MAKAGKIQIEPTDDAPSIILDEDTMTIQITGASFPEDAVDTFTPVLEWISNLPSKYEQTLQCDFDFSILSSASNKMVFEVLLKLEELHNSGCKVNVNWHYESFDEDMKDEGESFKETMKLPFNFVEK